MRDKSRAPEPLRPRRERGIYPAQGAPASAGSVLVRLRPLTIVRLDSQGAFLRLIQVEHQIFDVIVSSVVLDRLLVEAVDFEPLGKIKIACRFHGGYDVELNLF
jgi:hypothetical protein